MGKMPDEALLPDLVQNQRITTENAAYVVLQQLGAGGNSAVYLVAAKRGEHRGVLFALKVFLNVLDKTRLERFQNEISCLKNCDHPSIMRVYDAGEHHEGNTVFPFVIAEYLPKTLRDAMREGITITQKLAFTLQLLSGLEYLSKKSIVHRDIKPENILVRGRSCVFADFGLIKSGEPDDPTLDTKVEISTGIRFPRLYPTPDLIRYCKDTSGKCEITPKSDIFQLGLVLAELFSGSLPIKERKKYEDIVLEEISQIRGSQGTSIKGHIMSMLEMDPEKRPSASDLFDGWEGTFREVSKSAEQLEGAIF